MKTMNPKKIETNDAAITDTEITLVPERLQAAYDLRGMRVLFPSGLFSMNFHDVRNLT